MEIKTISVAISEDLKLICYSCDCEIPKGEERWHPLVDNERLYEIVPLCKRCKS